jgi:hypothetical protein
MQRRSQHRVQRSKPGSRKGVAAAAAATRKRLLKASRLEAKRLAERIVVNTANLRATGSYGVPDFVARGYYVDFPFRCKDCERHELWSATQQRWWYEVAKGDVWTVAARCRPCRQRERARRTAAREVSEAGMVRKRSMKRNNSQGRRRER